MKTSLYVALLAAVALVAPFALAPVVQAADACGPDANAIVCENSKPGAHWSEWEISGAGDSSIQGFATDISVNAGSTIDFKIDTDAADYDIDIYRTGWYQGLGARKVESVQPSAALPQIQPECLTDQTTELTDCGTWGVSASWAVPADAVSGVYIAKLTRGDDGGASHITFVVRNDGSTSDVLFQTSDTTWHAYNSYGGSNFYQGADNGRAYKLSYNRPFSTRNGIEARDFYFGAEYPMVRFMERNGYDVSYFSGVDTDRFGDQLTNHRTFLSVGHDEYWSGQQRDNVEAARDAGVNLQFLSGNEMYWRVRYEDSPADPAGGGHRTMVSYKETWSDRKIDPSAEWTGTFRDPRFASVDDGGGVPENALTGTAYVVNYGDFPVTVNDHEGSLRLWRETGLDDLQTGSREELAPHTVGYESNEDLPNGFRPPGLIHLSTTQGSVPEYLQDFGKQVAPGETTHHVTLYKASSGALVFSAGSVQWTWGLDEWHDGNGAPADPRMQQAQVNLLADMGVQPTTLMDGLTQTTASTDTAPPTVEVEETPAGPLPHGQQVTVSGTASDGSGPDTGSVAGVEYSVDAGETWWQADGREEWSFTYVISGLGEHTALVRAIDDSGNYPSAGTPITTAVDGPYGAFGTVQPKVSDTGDPAAVELGLRFSPTVDGVVSGVRFYRSEANTGPHTGTLWGLDGTPLAEVSFPAAEDDGWQAAEFQEPVTVTAGTDYVVSYSAPSGRYAADPYFFAYRGITDQPLRVAGGYGVPDVGVFGNTGEFPSRSYANTNYYVDAVFVPGEERPLSAGSHQPMNTAVSVPVDTPISTVLSRDVAPNSVGLNLVETTGGAEVSGSASYDPDTNRVTFTPDGQLQERTSYTASVSAQDASGNPIEVGADWTFTTWSTTPADDCPCGLMAETVLPTGTLIDDGRPVTLGTQFSTTEPGVVNGLEFYRAPGNTGSQTGTLFTANGTELARVDFSNDSASGWQYAELDEPVRLDPGTDYVVAYTTQKYSTTTGHWSQPTLTGPLQTPENAGRFSYTEPFPDRTSSTNYLADLRFTPDATAPAITQRTPAPGTVDAPADSQITATFDREIHPDAQLTASANGSTVEGTTTRTPDGTGLEWTPSEPFPAGAVVTVTITDAGPPEGTATTPVHSWTFRTASAETSTALSFLGNQEPATLNAGDSSAVELGMQLTTSQDITVQAIRFYRGTESGANGTGTLWDSSGNPLADVEFGPATGTGWQTALLEAPVPLAAGTTFTVSRHAPQGGYTYTSGDYAEPITQGALTLEGNNGRFAYGAGGTSPSNTWGNTNYFVDLLYTENTSD